MIRRFIFCIGLVLLCFGGCTTENVDSVRGAKFEADQEQVVAPAPLILHCLDGNKIPFAESETGAIVLVFISTDCPIANAYLPHLQRLDSQYGGRGIEIFLVHSSTDIDASSAKAHAEKFDVRLPIVVDANQVLANRVQASVTPEAVVLSRDSAEPVYRGSIDNLYADYGKSGGLRRNTTLRTHWTNCLPAKPFRFPKPNRSDALYPSVIELIVAIERSSRLWEELPSSLRALFRWNPIDNL